MKHRFVEYIPETLEDGVIYISIEFATVAHKCCCGCGNQVVTPLSPGDWRLTFDGESVSLHPSIGNWGFECCSHYWIVNNEVEWAMPWSEEEIRASREQDRHAKGAYYLDRIVPIRDASSIRLDAADNRSERPSLWSKLKNWWV